MTSRRALVSFGIGAGFSTLVGNGWAKASTPLLAARANRHAKKQLVCIFMRGGVDALNVVVPHGDDDYYKERREIAVPAPGKEANSVIRLDAMFGLNPGLSALLPLYRAGQLGFVHAVGSPNLTRSHFDAQDLMESGTPLDAFTRDGWLNRCVATLPTDVATSLLRAVAVGRSLPRALYGSQAALAINDVESFGLRAPGGVRERLQAGFRSMYGAGGDDAANAGLAAMTTVDLVREKTAGKYVPENGAEYPKPGRPLMNVARLLKADLGVEVAWVDAGGWDTHANQGAGVGQLAGRLKDLGDSLAAFHKDMGKRMRDVVVVTLSEFGRTVSQNGTGGTDHGHGGIMLLMGGKLQGGRVFGDWPGLALDKRHEGRDLAVTTDYRAVLAEVLTRHLGLPELAQVFPGLPSNSALNRKLFA